jgi:hypothetical protein
MCPQAFMPTLFPSESGRIFDKRVELKCANLERQGAVGAELN